ncbi:MAG: 3-oxoacyl-(acyl-carrier-protein) reductase [Marmoricola sp.]|nr:3-oxoacyl-(acyl-carrier-protein) reductase [Marmoricola sp.]
MSDGLATHTPSTVLVTAAAGGIGSALSRTLAATGHQLVLVDVSRRRLDKLEAQLREIGASAVLSLEGDLTDVEQAEDVIRRAEKEFGRLDGLANIVGGVIGDLETFYDKDIDLIDPEEWEATFAINVRPTYLMTRAAARTMRRTGGGSIVNVASMAHLGRIPQMGNVAYDAAKAAVVAMTHTLAWQLGPDNVRVNAVAPGLTLSAGLERIVTPSLVNSHREATPLGKNGRPEDVAETMAFLLGPKSGHVSGETIHVAGGRA